MVSPTEATTLAITGAIFFIGCFKLLQRFWTRSKLGLQITDRFQLTESDCTDISVKFISSLQALFSSICGLIVCRKCIQDVLYCTHPAIMLYAWFGASYFFYDAWAMFQVFLLRERHYKNAVKSRKKRGMIATAKEFIAFARQSPLIVIHHVIMAPIGFSIITHFRGERGDFFLGVMYLMEVSTPFVSFRAILSILKMKSTLLYKVNGAIMLFTFPLCRIVSVLYTVGVYAKQQHLGYFETFYVMHPVWKFVFVASMAPQIYWCFLMLNGLVKMLSHSSDPRVAEKTMNCRGATAD